MIGRYFFMKSVFKVLAFYFKEFTKAFVSIYSKHLIFPPYEPLCLFIVAV